MLTMVSTRCPSPHCVIASIFQRVRCSWVTSCSCQGIPVNTAAVNFSKASHGLCSPLGPDDGYAFWQRGVSIQPAFWLHRPIGWSPWPIIPVSGVAMPVCKPVCQAKSVQHPLVRYFFQLGTGCCKWLPGQVKTPTPMAAWMPSSTWPRIAEGSSSNPLLCWSMACTLSCLECLSQMSTTTKINYSGNNKEKQLQPSCNASIRLIHVTSLGNVLNSILKPPILLCVIFLMVASIDWSLPCCLLSHSIPQLLVNKKPTCWLKFKWPLGNKHQNKRHKYGKHYSKELLFTVSGGMPWAFRKCTHAPQ